MISLNVMGITCPYWNAKAGIVQIPKEN